MHSCSTNYARVSIYRNRKKKEINRNNSDKSAARAPTKEKKPIVGGLVRLFISRLRDFPGQNKFNVLFGSQNFRF